jgi:hypothetical protein
MRPPSEICSACSGVLERVAGVAAEVVTFRDVVRIESKVDAVDDFLANVLPRAAFVVNGCRERAGGVNGCVESSVEFSQGGKGR